MVHILFLLKREKRLLFCNKQDYSNIKKEKNRLYRIIAFDKNCSDYFISLPQKDLDNQLLKNTKIFSIEQGICIKEDIGEQLEKKGLPSANRILKSKLKRYNQTDTIHKERTKIFIL